MYDKCKIAIYEKGLTCYRTSKSTNMLEIINEALNASEVNDVKKITIKGNEHVQTS